YMVLHVDYRNHAGSDKDPDNDVGLRLGYTEDVIGAALALRSWDRAEVDAGRIGLFGRSMGGGVVYNALVVAPGLFDAAVAHAPVSGRPEENLDHFQRPDGDPIVERIEAEHGTPEENPEFWRQVSPLTHAARAADPLQIHHGTADDTCPPRRSREAAAALDAARAADPLQIHHGTADDTCPPRWSREAAAAFEAAGADVELRTYAGEGHTFGPRWRESMDVTMDFFARHLR